MNLIIKLEIMGTSYFLMFYKILAPTPDMSIKPQKTGGGVEGGGGFDLSKT